MKTILVTGANRGIGRLAAAELLRRGDRVILTARNPDRAAALRSELSAEIASGRAQVRPLDLASFASVRGLSAELIADGERLDAIVHNAGTLSPPPVRTITEDGIEQTLQIHAVAPWLLSTLLLPALARPSRLVFLGSSLHLPNSRGVPVRFSFDDPFLVEGYHPERAYKNAKLAQLWVVREWERRHGAEGVHADDLCPGFVPITASANTRGFMRVLLRRVMPIMPFATSPQAAARLEADWAERDPTIPGGAYFDGGTPTQPSEDARDDDTARSFWALLEAWAPV
ncbi:SDR family NAD(P)-dependent oxidoreductase [Lacisediminihabitans profunda]|uniref:SDR family NAD(P)-dependent oxidoreductase n=1 Tax=Lacisediminihabitans profunda TaxID=2594790 RepID=UPI001650C08B|nr:SDR family NAD(P)-dependent oxidoreductase [Lacisediminihabitans profunda]